MGWPAVIALLVLLLVLTAGCVRLSVRGWGDFLLVAVLAGALVRPTLVLITGDVSRWLPGWIWSDGADGKDQIVWVSAVASLLLPLIMGGLFALVGKAVWKRLVRR